MKQIRFARNRVARLFPHEYANFQYIFHAHFLTDLPSFIKRSTEHGFY